MCLFCQLWSCGEPVGNDKEAHLTTCSLELPLCVPKSVNIGHIYLNTKRCLTDTMNRCADNAFKHKSLQLAVQKGQGSGPHQQALSKEPKQGNSM